MSKIKKLLAEFKAFVTRGNVVDMAVAVIIGAAFTAIVTALTNGILMPLINWAVQSATGGIGLDGLRTPLGEAVYMVDATGAQIIDWSNTLYIDWGNFINAIIDFLLIALVLFTVIKVFMGLKNASNGIVGDEAKHKRQLIKKYRKEGLSLEEAIKKADETIAAENVPAPEAPAAPTTEELLTQIRDLLAAQNATDKKEED